MSSSADADGAEGTCLDLASRTMGIYVGFTLICDCAGADRDAAESMWKGILEKTCGAAAVEEMTPYIDYVLVRSDRVEGRCAEMCDTPLALMVSDVLLLLRGEPLPQRDRTVALSSSGIADALEGLGEGGDNHLGEGSSADR